MKTAVRVYKHPFASDLYSTLTVDGDLVTLDGILGAVFSKIKLKGECGTFAAWVGRDVLALLMESGWIVLYHVMESTLLQEWKIRKGFEVTAMAGNSEDTLVYAVHGNHKWSLMMYSMKDGQHGPTQVLDGKKVVGGKKCYVTSMDQVEDKVVAATNQGMIMVLQVNEKGGLQVLHEWSHVVGVHFVRLYMDNDGLGCVAVFMHNQATKYRINDTQVNTIHTYTIRSSQDTISEPILKVVVHDKGDYMVVIQDSFDKGPLLRFVCLHDPECWPQYIHNAPELKVEMDVHTISIFQDDRDHIGYFVPQSTSSFQRIKQRCIVRRSIEMCCSTQVQFCTQQFTSTSAMAMELLQASISKDGTCIQIDKVNLQRGSTNPIASIQVEQPWIIKQLQVQANISFTKGLVFTQCRNAIKPKIWVFATDSETVYDSFFGRSPCFVETTDGDALLELVVALKAGENEVQLLKPNEQNKFSVIQTYKCQLPTKQIVRTPLKSEWTSNLHGMTTKDILLYVVNYNNHDILIFSQNAYQCEKDGLNYSARQGIPSFPLLPTESFVSVQWQPLHKSGVQNKVAVQTTSRLVILSSQLVAIGSYIPSIPIQMVTSYLWLGNAILFSTISCELRYVSCPNQVCNICVPMNSQYVQPTTANKKTIIISLTAVVDNSLFVLARKENDDHGNFVLPFLALEPLVVGLLSPFNCRHKVTKHEDIEKVLLKLVAHYTSNESMSTSMFKIVSKKLVIMLFEANYFQIADDLLSKSLQNSVKMESMDMRILYSKCALLLGDLDGAIARLQECENLDLVQDELTKLQSLLLQLGSPELAFKCKPENSTAMILDQIMQYDVQDNSLLCCLGNLRNQYHIDASFIAKANKIKASYVEDDLIDLKKRNKSLAIETIKPFMPAIAMSVDIGPPLVANDSETKQFMSSAVKLDTISSYFGQAIETARRPSKLTLSVSGVVDSGNRKPLRLGPFIDEEDAVVGYWRPYFENSQVKLEDLTRYANTGESFGDAACSVVNPSGAPIEIGEADPAQVYDINRIQKLVIASQAMCISLSSNGRTSENPDWGIKFCVEINSSLDVGMSYHVSRDRRQLAAELWFCPKSSASDNRKSLLCRMQDTLILWNIVVIDTRIVFEVGSECIALNMEEYNSWNHVAVSSKARNDKKLALRLHLNGSSSVEKVVPCPEFCASTETFIILGHGLCMFDIAELRIWAKARTLDDIDDAKNNYLELATRKQKLSVAIHEVTCKCTKCTSRKSPQLSPVLLRSPRGMPSPRQNSNVNGVVSPFQSPRGETLVKAESTATKLPMSKSTELPLTEKEPAQLVRTALQYMSTFEYSKAALGFKEAIQIYGTLHLKDQSASLQSKLVFCAKYKLAIQLHRKRNSTESPLYRAALGIRFKDIPLQTRHRLDFLVPVIQENAALQNYEIVQHLLENILAMTVPSHHQASISFMQQNLPTEVVNHQPWMVPCPFCNTSVTFHSSICVHCSTQFKFCYETFDIVIPSKIAYCTTCAALYGNIRKSGQKCPSCHLATLQT